MVDAPVPPSVPAVSTQSPAAEVGHEAKKPEPASPAAPDWFALQPELQLSGSAQVIASHCEWLGAEGACVRLRLDPAQSNLFNARHTERIRTALSAALGQPELALDIVVGPLQGESPAQQRQRLYAESRTAALQRVRDDARVQALVSRFSATVDESGIELLSDRGASP